MAIIRWNPWNLSSMFEDDFDLPTVPGLSRVAGQGLNIYETEDSVFAEAALPGIPEEKVDVTVEDGIVRITGAHEDSQEDKAARRYFMTSRMNSFNYSFRLPQGIVDDQEPTCILENGILTVQFEKVKKAPPKKLKVTAKKTT